MPCKASQRAAWKENNKDATSHYFHNIQNHQFASLSSRSIKRLPSSGKGIGTTH